MSNKSCLILLFGKSFSGGALELLNSGYSKFYFYSPEIYCKSKNLINLYQLSFEKCKLSIFLRVYNTFKFLYFDDHTHYYLTHSIQALIFPKIFPRRNFIWICQGIEVFSNPYLLKILKNIVFLLLDQKNLTISVVNKLLYDYIKSNIVVNAKIELDSYIKLEVADFGKRKLILNYPKKIFVCLRDSTCKNSNLAISIIKKLENDKSIHFIVLDLRERKFNDIQKVNLTYISDQISHSDLLNFLTQSDYILYPSYFEGFGLLVNEALALGVIPIVGPLCLFANHLNVITIQDYKIKSWLDQLSISKI